MVIPLHNTMCCHALHALMELGGSSGAEGGRVQTQLARKETRQSEVLLRKPRGLVWNPSLCCSHVTVFPGRHLQRCVLKSQRRFLSQMYCGAASCPTDPPSSCPSCVRLPLPWQRFLQLRRHFCCFLPSLYLTVGLAWVLMKFQLFLSLWNGLLVWSTLPAATCQSVEVSDSLLKEKLGFNSAHLPWKPQLQPLLLTVQFSLPREMPSIPLSYINKAKAPLKCHQIEKCFYYKIPWLIFCSPTSTISMASCSAFLAP